MSVKQTADGKRDARISQEGSGFGGLATTWLQRHPTPGEDFQCDGKWHTDTFRVDTTEIAVIDEEGNTAQVGRGELQKGQAWIQFCLFGGDGAPAFSQRWGSVK